MSAKEEVSKETPTRADVEALLAHWDFPFPLREFKLLFGGYSGTSVKVVGGNGVRHVLKICHGYEQADVEAFLAWRSSKGSTSATSCSYNCV